MADKVGRGIGADAASPLSGGLPRLRVWAMVVALGACAVGCSEREERQVSAKEVFEIPLTLVQRMMEAHDKVLSNAQEVVTQPRGEMQFAVDGLDEAGLTRIWPFDLESYEKELEGQMARDTNGLYRLLGKFAEGVRAVHG